MSKWNKETYAEYLNNPERLSLDRDMAILRNLQDMDIESLEEDAPEIRGKGDIVLYNAWRDRRNRALFNLRSLTQAYKNLVATEHNKQLTSNLTVKIDMNFVSQFMQIVLSEVQDLDTRKRISSRLESFASQRQISAENTIPEEDPTLIIQEPLPRLIELNEEILPKRYRMKEV